MQFRTARTLTKSEKRALELFHRGLRYEQIAAELDISSKTVEAHLASCREKLGVATSREAARLYTDSMQDRELGQAEIHLDRAVEEIAKARGHVSTARQGLARPFVWMGSALLLVGVAGWGTWNLAVPNVDSVEQRLRADPDLRYVGSKRSKMYHALDSHYVRQIKPDNVVGFSTRAEAEAAGYRPAQSLQEQAETSPPLGH